MTLKSLVETSQYQTAALMLPMVKLDSHSQLEIAYKLGKWDTHVQAEMSSCLFIKFVVCRMFEYASRGSSGMIEQL